MLSQKSEDGPHIAVKTQSNNTPNGRPQYSEVPLQGWAVFITPLSYNVQVLCPLLSLRGEILRTVVIPHGPSRYIQMPTPLGCCVDWHNRLAQMLHIFVLLLIPSRNFSFIRIAVLPTHYAVCQPLQLSTCQVHPQRVIKPQLEQPSNIELLWLPWCWVPWF